MHERYIERFMTLDDSMFESLTRPPDEVEALRELVETIPPHLGIRAAFATTIPPLLQRIAPHAITTYSKFASKFEVPGPFSYLPVRQLLVYVAMSASLAFPDDPLPQGIERVVESARELLFELPIMGPMIGASGGDFGEFVRALALTQNLFYDHGEMVFERKGPRSIVLYYDGQAAAWMEAVVDGFWRGMMQVFELDGEVGFRRFSDTTSESWMRW